MVRATDRGRRGETWLALLVFCCTANSLHAQVGLRAPRQLADTAVAPTLFWLRPPASDLPASPLARAWPYYVLRPARPMGCPMPVFAPDSIGRDRMPIVRHDSSRSERMPVASGGCVNDLQRKQSPRR